MEVSSLFKIFRLFEHINFKHLTFKVIKTAKNSEFLKINFNKINKLE